MSTYKVNVKWTKEKFTGVELDTSEPPEVFKAQLMALTGVLPDRQKVILKGGTLVKDTWDGIKGLKDGITITMMGSATELPQAPTEKTVFVEDMTEQQLASRLKLPSGLENLGNTCYMSATVQCLKSIPELCDALSAFSEPPAAAAAADTGITTELKTLVRTLDDSSDSVQPLAFLQQIFRTYPRFAERSEHGGFVQQDANEFWGELIRCLQQELIQPGKVTPFIDEYMRINLSQTWKCVESEEEPPTQLEEKAYQLSCFIDNNVKHMMTGLKSGMKEHISKRSPILDRDAQYEKSSVLSRLPAYLSIQFIRFEFKTNKAVNAKILKDVKFTPSLDLFEMCSEELQKKLIPMREMIKEEEDRQEEAIKQAKIQGEPLIKDRKKTKQPYSFPGDEGSNNSGLYELQAVLTHKGRSSSSGHYVAWVKSTESNDDWIKYDDDKISYVKLEDIKGLSGGGDWHTAYVLLYGPKVLQVEEKTEETAVAKSELMQE